MRRLPSWMTDKYLRKGDCPLYHYGVPIRTDKLREYGVKNDLINLNGGLLSFPRSIPRILSHIAKRCDGPVKLHHALITHPRNTGVIALFTNFTQHRRQRSPDEEAAIFQAIVAEVGLSPHLKPLWYWDIEEPETMGMNTVRSNIFLVELCSLEREQPCPIPREVLRHVKKKWGPESLNQGVEPESSDEEIKAQLSSEYESETDFESSDDEESDAEESTGGDETAKMSDAESAVKT